MGFGSRVSAVGRSMRTGPVRVGRYARRATHAQGAGRTGLGSLIESQAINSAGDAMVAVALAGTIFFGLDVNQARNQVALYLLVTMAPFALVAPMIGPALDRLRHARRFSIAATMLGRALLCWAMAGAVLHGDQVTFLPAAFGALVLSKAFGVLRTAVTPRVLPDQITLVTANARASFAGLIAASIAAPIAAGLAALIGPDWLLRLTTVVFAIGAIMGMRLPKHVDTPETDAPPERPNGHGRRWRTLHRVGPVVAEAMQANAALRAFSGFLILYLAFLLRGERFDPVSPNVALGMLAASAGAGGLAGTGLGAWMKARAPRFIILATLTFATAVAAVGAVFFGLWAALVVAFVAGFGQSLGKLSMDAVVQREIGEEVRSSTFAVSETLHQLVWVLGGLAGLGMSIWADGRVALSIVAGALALALLALAAKRARERGDAPDGADGPRGANRPNGPDGPHNADGPHGPDVADGGSDGPRGPNVASGGSDGPRGPNVADGGPDGPRSGGSDRPRGADVAGGGSDRPRDADLASGGSDGPRGADVASGSGSAGGAAGSGGAEGGGSGGRWRGRRRHAGRDSTEPASP